MRRSAFAYYRTLRASPRTVDLFAEDARDLAGQVATMEAEGGPELPDHVAPYAPRPYLGHESIVRCRFCGRTFMAHDSALYGFSPERARALEWADHHARAGSLEVA
jgi:hypothetical protein